MRRTVEVVHGPTDGRLVEQPGPAARALKPTDAGEVDPLRGELLKGVGGIVGAGHGADPHLRAPEGGRERCMQHRATWLTHEGLAVAEHDVVYQQVAEQHDVGTGSIHHR